MPLIACGERLRCPAVRNGSEPVNFLAFRVSFMSPKLLISRFGYDGVPERGGSRVLGRDFMFGHGSREPFRGSFLPFRPARSGWGTLLLVLLR